MSTLVLDARWLNTGLGTYTLNLIREISQRQNIQLRLLTLPQYREYLAKYNCAITIVDTPIYSIQEQFTIAWASRGSRVLHVPHYNAPLTRVGSLLVTIHDLTHILDHAQRRSIKSWIYAQPMLRMVSRRADHIFTVSEYSKRQIVELLGVNPERITVVYNGVGPHLFPEPRDEARAKTNRDFSFVGPYILFVGNLKPFKNVAGLIKAFSLLKERSRLPYRLLVIGDDAAGRPGLIKLAMQLGLDGSVIFVPRVSDEQVRAAYSGADLTVLPSLEEGFGLPVLESMTCGTPVACSSAASLPEIGGQAAEYFDPRDIESIANSLQTVLLNSDRWSELRQLGLERAGHFTREECAKRHLPVYRRYLGLSAAD
jgi:glycosyltransferase involved in cell wall biosynthesis